MSQKLVQTMLAENQETRKILAELGALLGAAAQPEPQLYQKGRKA